jgi:hypothetical protein
MKLAFGKNLLIRKIENLAEEEAISTMARSWWVGLRRAERLFELPQGMRYLSYAQAQGQAFACLPDIKKGCVPEMINCR